MTARLIDDAERRVRLARRHAISPAHRVADAVAATRAMTVLHSTEPATPYLSVHARVDGFTRDAMAAAMYDERSLVKQLAMRRTLFVFPEDLLPAALGSASSRVAGQEAAKVIKDLHASGVTIDGATWLAAAREAVLRRLSSSEGMTTTQLREEVVELEGKVVQSPGKAYGGEFHVAPRVLTYLSATGDVVRGSNNGHWRLSKPRWATMTGWLGVPVAPLAEAAGYAELVARYLRTFGPVTERDIMWWLGSTKAVVRKALTDNSAVEVALERNGTGWVLPDDVDPEPVVESWAALLPVLDPTTMGWKDRDFYLAPDDAPYLFDTAGNGGTTAWWNGRIVGGYVQDKAGQVDLVLRTDPGREGRAALRREAKRLTAWLDGEVVTSVYKSALMKGEPLP